MERTQQHQFEVLVDYMELNGDLSRSCTGAEQLEYLRKWNELTALLNQHGAVKSVNKWRKVWSDFKNNTRRKEERLKRGGSTKTFTPIEVRVLNLISETKKRTHDQVDDSNLGSFIKEDPVEDSQSSITAPNDDSLLPNTNDYLAINMHESLPPNTQDSSPPKTRYFLIKSKPQKIRPSSPCSTDSAPPEKKKKVEKVREMRDDNVEFEKEREKMTHEREMAWIRQSDQLISYLGRVVNVIEHLAPSLQRYLDRS